MEKEIPCGLLLGLGDRIGPVKNAEEALAIDRLEELGRYAFLVPEDETDIRQLTLADLPEPEPEPKAEVPLRFGSIDIDACFGRRW